MVQVGHKSSAEQQFQAYKESLEQDDDDEIKGELLLELRGVFTPLYIQNDKGEDIHVGYSAIDSGEPVTINRILYYKSSTPLSVTWEKSGDKLKRILVKGDGNLSIVSATTIWKWGFEIDIDCTRFMTYDTNDYQTSNDILMVPKLELTGLGYVVQNLKGLFFDFKYGELGKTDDGLYTISFGGSLNIPLGVKKEALPQKATTGSGGTSTTPAPTSAPSSPSGSSSSKGKSFKEFANENKDRLDPFDGNFLLKLKMYCSENGPVMTPVLSVWL